MKHYHKTTNTAPDELRRYQTAAKTQDEKVLGWFLAHAGQALTASQVHTGMLQVGIIPINTPLTSIRRAMSNLSGGGQWATANRPRLVKTDETRIGLYGRREHAYRLVTGQQELQL